MYLTFTQKCYIVVKQKSYKKEIQYYSITSSLSTWELRPVSFQCWQPLYCPLLEMNDVKCDVRVTFLHDSKVIVCILQVTGLNINKNGRHDFQMILLNIGLTSFCLYVWK